MFRISSDVFIINSIHIRIRSEIDEVGKQVAMTSQGKSSNICPIEEVRFRNEMNL